MKKYIPYGRQHIDDNDIQTIINILKSDWLTQGPVIEEFENKCAAFCQVNFAIAVSNATAGLHLACLALELGEGDILWTSPNTFVASSNCALYCGATVDFVDIDPRTYNISIHALADKLQWASKNNKLPKILVVVHFAGQSCEMKEIKQLADQYQIKIIEDASHAIGGEYLNKKIGSCEYSEVAIFSFHPVKIITTGEGGMVVTNSPQLKEKIAALRTHGITRNAELMTEHTHGPWYYQQLDLGYNYRLTDIQAGLGLSQLQRIDAFIERRKAIANRYDQELKNLPIILPWQSPNTSSALHLYPIQIDKLKTNKTRKEVFNELREAGIGVNVHYIPVHTQPYYQAMGFKWGDYPHSESYYENTISLPIHYPLSEEEQTYIILTLEKILKYRHE